VSKMVGKVDIEQHTFIISWSDDTLEWVVDVTGYDKKQMWHVLGGGEPISLPTTIKHAIMYARTDKTKQFEVYSITAEAGFTARDITNLFKEDPITSVETIRKLGTPLHTFNQKESL